MLWTCMKCPATSRAQEFAERGAGAAGQAFVFVERKEHDVAGVVMNELRTIDERATENVSERALRKMK